MLNFLGQVEASSRIVVFLLEYRIKKYPYFNFATVLMPLSLFILTIGAERHVLHQTVFSQRCLPRGRAPAYLILLEFFSINYYFYYTSERKSHHYLSHVFLPYLLEERKREITEFSQGD